MRIVAFVVLLVVCLSGFCHAESSRIETTDGGILIGEIISFKDGVYRIRTGYGEVTVTASAVKSISNFPGAPPSVPVTAPDARQPGGSGDLALQGSNTIGAKLMPALLEAYFGRYPNVSLEWIQGATAQDRTLVVKTSAAARPLQVQLGSHGTATGFDALIANNADIGDASEPINEKQLQEAMEAGLGDLRSPDSGEHVLALDGLVILVNKSNGLTTLDLDTIARIFAGEFADWSMVPGSSMRGPIHLYVRDENSGTHDIFSKLLMKGLNQGTPFKPGFNSNEELSDAVAADPLGIGYSGFAYVRNARALSLKTKCGQVFKPLIFPVKTEEYPLSRRLFLYTPLRKPRELAGSFLSYALSPEAQRVVSNSGFINFDIQPSADSYAGDRFADMMADSTNDYSLMKALSDHIRKAHRLSVTFRFRTDSFELDSRALPDLDRLIAYLKQPSLQGRKIMLIGFSDVRGDAAYNLALSRRRADTVAMALRQKSLILTDVSGFGPLAPVACSDTDDGLAKNRRVEIWID